MSMLAGLLGGGGGGGGVKADSQATGSQQIGGDTYVMPTPAPFLSAGGFSLSGNTGLILAAALGAVVLVLLFKRK